MPTSTTTAHGRVITVPPATPTAKSSATSMLLPLQAHILERMSPEITDIAKWAPPDGGVLLADSPDFSSYSTLQSASVAVRRRGGGGCDSARASVTGSEAVEVPRRVGGLLPGLGECDVVLVLADGSRLPVHSCLLATFSGAFRELFLGITGIGSGRCRRGHRRRGRHPSTQRSPNQKDRWHGGNGVSIINVSHPSALEGGERGMESAKKRDDGKEEAVVSKSMDKIPPAATQATTQLGTAKAVTSASDANSGCGGGGSGDDRGEISRREGEVNTSIAGNGRRLTEGDVLVPLVGPTVVSQLRQSDRTLAMATGGTERTIPAAAAVAQGTTQNVTASSRTVILTPFVTSCDEEERQARARDVLALLANNTATNDNTNSNNSNSKELFVQIPNVNIVTSSTASDYGIAAVPSGLTTLELVATVAVGAATTAAAEAAAVAGGTQVASTLTPAATLPATFVQDPTGCSASAVAWGEDRGEVLVRFWGAGTMAAVVKYLYCGRPPTDVVHDQDGLARLLVAATSLRMPR